VGESGSGKSVTALTIMGLLSREAKIESGKVCFDDEVIFDAEKGKDEKLLRSYRGKLMSMVFADCRSLTTIYCKNNWSASSAASTEMFDGCSSLTGGMGSAFDGTHTDKTYARMDRGEGQPGYFTRPEYPNGRFTINEEGDLQETKTGKKMRELDPMREDEDWKVALGRVFDHYSNRMWDKVERTHQERYNKFWNALIEDSVIVAMMRDDKSVKGDEHEDLGVKYNAKAIFNIFGMLFKRDFFTGIKGYEPLAIAVTEHYDSESLKKVHAKAEYFKPEQTNTLPQFLGITSDLRERIVKMMK
jgi:ABC-type oligopeptide transport system ATPase subunit